ncbi:NPH3 domain-containing protein [Dioscorea alata]|uniref:NPH3 domain-containing protein n=1 Tax=Dioscorea alata TaxID=55571 RepID=A0ACB7WCF8_DIOAL|nr:NPH3 domain-containing protein [Dioscorea alata]
MSSRSATLSKLLQTNNYIDLSIFTDIPATVAVEAFKLVAIFSYNVPPPLTSDNIIPVACLAAFLSMTEDHSPNNLLKLSLSFFSSQILPNWNSTVKAFKCTELLISHAQQLGLIEACLNSISGKAFADPSLLNPPFPVDSKPSACRRLFSSSSSSSSSNEDITSLSLPLFELAIACLSLSGISPDHIGHCLFRYANKGCQETSSIYERSKNKKIIESVVGLIPNKRGSVHASNLLQILRAAIDLHANKACIHGLESMIAMQLTEVSIEDLLTHDIECMKRILSYFIASCETESNAKEAEFVIEIMEEYAGEMAREGSLGKDEFVGFMDRMRVLLDHLGRCYDGVYRAVDIYLDAHGDLTEREREEVCRVLSCRRMSEEACVHAAQNERLPMRFVAQVLFIGQMRIREVLINGDELSSSEKERKKKVMIMEEEEEEMKMEMEKVKKKRKKGVWKEMKELFGCKSGCDKE